MIVEIAAGVGGFIAGLASTLSYSTLRRRKAPREVLDLQPEVAAAIERAAQEWASTQSNPYAEEVARSWTESFFRSGLLDDRIVRRPQAGARK